MLKVGTKNDINRLAKNLIKQLRSENITRKDSPLVCRIYVQGTRVISGLKCRGGWSIYITDSFPVISDDGQRMETWTWSSSSELNLEG